MVLTSRDPAIGQGGQVLPLRQSRLTRQTAGAPLPVDLDAAAHEDRWLGSGIRFRDRDGAEDVRWSADGRWLYFQWNPEPKPGQAPGADPWWRVDRDAGRVERVTEDESRLIPAAQLSWSASGERAAWVSSGRVYFFDGSANRTRLVYAGASGARRVRMRLDGRALHLVIAGDLWEWTPETGSLRQRTRRVDRPAARTEQAGWLEAQQDELFETHRARDARLRAAAARTRADEAIQAIPLDAGWLIDDVQLSPDEAFVVCRVRRPARNSVRTRYADYASASGYTEIQEARPKVGDPHAENGLVVIPLAPAADPDTVTVKWVALKEPAAKNAVLDGLTWSPDGRRAVVQVMSLGHKDRWICALDVPAAELAVLVHDHDDAWLGGPPPVAGNLRPALFEWLDDGRFVFASERTGYSHLYLADAGRPGQVRALTEGPWEVRDAVLSRDRSRWLVAAGRESPRDDDLYTMPAGGGPFTRLTTREGRHAGLLSPDGTRLAIVASDAVTLPDLFLTSATPGTPVTRITESGTDNFYRHRLVKPVAVPIPLPSDGRPVWANVYDPPAARKNGAAIVHIHGGGYRQFTHDGFSVYGWGIHLGLVHYFLERGYTVLDLDYRGSSGYGRDYRTDIYQAMGGKDIEGGVAAVDWLGRERRIDRARVGVYGVSYGGFFTLMALFTRPGVFAAGVANAAVSDWAHYNELWTSRILGAPATSTEAYKRSSPIYFAGGLRDPLLIVHGLVDDNVHFQDAARVAQRLIELQKPFELAVYPMERHTFAEESSMHDYARRISGFFERHLLKKP
jgi:dipeptidyl aminopeptidase/acylaminoacyl peptidase